MWSDRPARFWDPATPVHFDEEQGAWQVFAYDDLLRVLNERETFSSAWLDGAAREQANPTQVGLWAADGGRHRDLRALVTEPFRAAVVRALTDEITAVAVELIGAVAGTGRFEAVEALARPLPVRVICRILGVDVGVAHTMHEWRDDLYAAQGTASELPPQPEMADALRELVAVGAKAPVPGVLADLVRAQAAGYDVDGQPLSDWDLVGYLAMLVWAAAETTAASIADALLFLTEYGHWDELGRDPSLVPNAVEEVLRWYPAFPGCSRLVVADTEIGGQAIRAGEAVTGWLTSANRDPAQFPEPDRFDIRRHPNRHLSFGAGRHLCLGAALARIELRVVVEEAARRLPGLRRDPDQPVRRRVWMEDSVDEVHFLTGAAGLSGGDRA